MKNRNLMPLILCFAACLTFLLAGTSPAHGQGMARFEVTSARDERDLSPGDYKCLSISGECTLRAAVEQANYYGGGPHTIVLRDEIYVLEDPLTIEAHLRIQDDCNLTLERSDRAGSQRKPLSPRLRPLDATTWWPPFHAPEAQSPAVDHGNPAGCNMPITELRLGSDQLEKTRHQGAECDAGAVE